MPNFLSRKSPCSNKNYPLHTVCLVKRLMCDKIGLTKTVVLQIKDNLEARLLWERFIQVKQVGFT